MCAYEYLIAHFGKSISFGFHFALCDFASEGAQRDAGENKGCEFNVIFHFG